MRTRPHCVIQRLPDLPRDDALHSEHDLPSTLQPTYRYVRQRSANTAQQSHHCEMSPYDSLTTRTCTTATASTHDFDPSVWLVPDDNHDLMSVHDRHDLASLPAWYRSGEHNRQRVSSGLGASPSSTCAQQRVLKHQRTAADLAVSAS